MFSPSHQPRALAAVLLAALSACGDGSSGKSPPPAAAASPAVAVAADELRYDRDVRPILSDHCFTCHGQDPGKRQAKLRLDRPDGDGTLHGGHDELAARPADSEI